MMATIMLCTTWDLESNRGVIDKFRIDLRNLRERNARIDKRWNSVGAFGQVEIDAVPFYEWSDIPSERRAVLDALPTEGLGDDVIWIPHAHMAILAPELCVGDVKQVLSRQWPGLGRVDVRGFDVTNDAEENAQRIYEYASKFRMPNKKRVMIDGGERYWMTESWSVEMQAQFWTWQRSMGRRLSPFRVKLSVRKPRLDKVFDAERICKALFLDLWHGVPLPILV